jgi:5-methylcytosine-specific restriction endonuclease McrA
MKSIPEHLWPPCPKCDSHPANVYIYDGLKPRFYCRECQKTFTIPSPKKPARRPRGKLHCTFRGCRDAATPAVGPWAPLCFRHRQLIRAKAGMLDTSAGRERWKQSGMSKSRRPAILDRLGRRCVWCGEERESLLQVDHILEKRLHPELVEDPDNLQVLCRPCHSAKTAATLQAIVAAARLYPGTDALVEQCLDDVRANTREWLKHEA